MGIPHAEPRSVVAPSNKVKVFNLSSTSLPAGAISVAQLGSKYVPHAPSDLETTKIDILNFSRLLLLKAQFHNSTYNDVSVIKPVSNFVPKCTHLESLKGIVEDLELLAGDIVDFERTNITDNLTPHQREGLNFLKTQKNLLYFEADKGSGIVFLDSDYYCELVMKKLDTPNYEKLVGNADYLTNLKLAGLVRKFSQVLTAKEKRAILDFDYKSTLIYGVPKIHKSQLIKNALKDCHTTCLSLLRPDDLALRIIFGGTCNPTTGIADMVDVLLKPFIYLVKARVRDVTDFINTIPHFGPTDLPHIQMCSVDVKDMYQSIEHDLGLKAVEFWLDRYPEKLPERFPKKFVLEALLFVLQNNTGYFNGHFYKQVRGTATGIKPAPVYADLVMGYLEISLFYKIQSDLGNQVADYFWRHFRRYLDDGQIMWDTRLCDFACVLNRMNSLHPSIVFTSDCKPDKLVYLNVTILKTMYGFKTEIYNKDTDSDSYLPFESSHPRSCKDAIPFELARSVRRLTDSDETVNLKLEQLQTRLERCSYPQGLVATAMKNAKSLDKYDLRTVKDKEPSSNEIAFVHTYDPELPQIFPKIKEITSRLYTSRELKPIFGQTKIINSHREPPSLGLQLQNSRFEDSTVSVREAGVTKCGRNKCASCADILEVRSFYFRNSGINFQIRTPMDCTVRNLIYVIQCKKCSFTYIGETVNFRRRMSAHKSNSSSSVNASADISRHLCKCGEGFWRCPIYKVKQESKIARLVMEDKLIKKLKPDLNRDQRNLLHLTTIPTQTPE